MFSKSCEYGIRAAVFVASKSLKGERVTLQIIAEEISSPKPFTAKILQNLVRKNLLSSIKGPGGGFIVSKEDMKMITLGDLVYAIDGDKLITNCGLGIKKCSNINPCPIHRKWTVMKTELKKILDFSTLYDMAIDKNKGNSVLN